MRKLLRINNLKGISTFIGMVSVGVFVIYASSVFAGELGYKPNDKPPYKIDGEGYSKRDLQNTLFNITKEPKEFKRRFEYFNQFYGGLDINWILPVDLDDSYLTWSTHLRHWDIIPYLIERNINLNYQNWSKDTGLMYAAYCGYFSVVEQLVLAGADIALKNKEGKTALDIAKKGEEKNYCSNGDYESVISYLNREQRRVSRKKDKSFSKN